ncbi:MAG: helix-turn-helix domain-containing protein [Bacteroidales bacterium]|nr:helix-turn-helix domain-containing protein [Bacteroidales bacterium]
MDHVAIGVEPPLVFVVFLIITAISGPVYFWVTFMKINKIRKSILNNYSTTKDINLEWLKTLIYIFGLIWSALIITAVIHHVFHYFSMTFCTDGLFLSLSAFIILVGFFGLRQKEIFTRFQEPDIEFVTDPKVKYQNIPLSETEMADYIAKINGIMEQKKPYLDPELTLPALAALIDIPSYQLSRVINEKFGRNFFDFINGYRVNEVKEKINDPAFQNLSILGIAFECGFNSKSAFNRIFKKMTGLTPSEYKKSGE